MSRNEMRARQHLVDQSVGLIKQPLPYRARNDQRQQPGQEKKSTQQATQGEAPVKKERQGLTDQKLRHNGQDRKKQGVERRDFKGRILKIGQIIRQADKIR